MFRREGNTQSYSSYTNNPDNVWRERIEKENHTAQVLWPHKWGWLSDNYRKELGGKSSATGSRLDLCSTSPDKSPSTVCNVHTVSEVTDLPSENGAHKRKRTQTNIPLSRPSSTVTELKQYPRYSRRFTTTNAQEHGYTAGMFADAGQFNKDKHLMPQSFYDQLDWPSRRWPVDLRH